MRARKQKIVIAIVLIVILVITNLNVTYLKHADAKSYTTPAHSSVHDPSIIDGRDGYYYIFGSNQGVARSKDLVNWSDFNTTIYKGGAVKALAKSFAWAGNDIGSTISLWAPSPIWNPYYENGDGSTGAFMLYYPTCSNYKRASIGFAVSDKVASDYTYGDTIMYSGFTTSGGSDGTGTKVDTIWKNTNLNKLIADKSFTFNKNWTLSDGSYNAGDYPLAIDPTVFFDQDNRLWMVYGSHGGGIWMIELDPKTGECIYPRTDSVNEDGVKVDRYFGYHLTSEGEGPYIIYNAETGYYYLSVTYGQITEGYNQRLFRSKEVTGPYTDAAAKSGVYMEGVRNQDELGVKLMGNYKFNATTSYKHGGHNSMIFADGGLFNIYHQRFASGPSYSNRIHQMLINEKGWPCMALYEYTGDKVSSKGYNESEIIGTYEFVNHGSVTSSAMLSTVIINLNKDGTITGDITGAWSMTKGTCYMQVAINGVTYYGSFFKQQDESATSHKVMTFTAIGENNEAIWASRLDLSSDDKKAAQAAADALLLPGSTNTDIALPVKGEFGTTISWASNNKCIASDGTVTRPSGKDASCKLTAKITKGKAVITKSFNVTVDKTTKSTELYKLQKLYEYSFTTTDRYLTQNTGTLTGIGVLVGKAKVINEKEQGLCLQTSDKADYLSLPADTLKGLTKGFTFSMWAKSSDNGTLLSIEGDTLSITLGTDLKASINVSGKKSTVKSKEGVANDWAFVGLTVDKTGIKIYKNAKLVGKLSIDLSKDFKKGLDANMLYKIGGNEVMIDNLAIYGSVLSDKAFKGEYSPENSWVTNWQIDFGPDPSPRWGTFTQMYNTTLYSRNGVTQGYGFTELIDGHESPVGGNKIRDFVYKAGGGEYTFKIDLPNGKYKVFVYTGNKEADNVTNFYFQDDVAAVRTQATKEGVASDNYGGPNTYEVEVKNKVLSITFWGDSTVAKDGFSGALNSLEISLIKRY